MTIEVEIKCPVNNLEDIEFELISKKAQLSEIVMQRDHYYNHPSKDYSKTDEALRIREEGDCFFLTYKGPKLDELSKSRLECNLKIDNFTTMNEILIALGFTYVLVVLKERKSYKIDDIVISLDRIEGLGDFVELELQIETEEELVKARKRLTSQAKIFSINTNSQIRESYLELLLKKMDAK